MIELNITGVEKTIEKCLALESLTNRVMYDGMKKSLEKLKNVAEENLRKSLLETTVLEQLGYARNQHGWPQVSINEAWEILDGEMKYGEINGTLVNWSQHAAAVEFGVPGRIYPRTAKVLALGPGGPYFASVRGQQGKFFLTNAMNQGEEIAEEIYGTMLKREISTLLLR